MDEFSFIDSIKQHTYRQSSLITGVGDDAAVFRQQTEDIVTAVDTFVEGVHFLRETMEPRDIGYRALAANLSDLAAMGARAAFYLVSIVIPSSWSMVDIGEIFAGMKVLANEYQLDLIGGDTVSGKELVISITVIGYVEQGKSRLRDAAEIDDVLFVTGTLGDSRAGLHILMNMGDYTDADYFISRHRLPSPRIAFAQALKSLKRVALNDISDGLANEAAEIATASSVDIRIDPLLLPLHPAYQQFTNEQQENWKYFGGEDFELLGTVSKTDWPAVQKAALNTNTFVTQIGSTLLQRNKIASVYIDEANTFRILKKSGYTHLK